MFKVAVLFQFRCTFPQDRVGSDCAIPNRQFQKTAFSVSIPTGRCRGLRVFVANRTWLSNFNSQLAVSKNGLSSFNSQPAVSKTAFPVSIPGRQFQKTAFPVSSPSRQFQKRGNDGPKKRGVCKGAWPSFSKKGLKVAVLVQFRRTFPPKKRYSTAAFPCKGSDCAIPSSFKKRLFQFQFPLGIPVH